MNATQEFDRIKMDIMAQIDMGINNFTLKEAGDEKVLEFSKMIVRTAVGRLTVNAVNELHPLIVEKSVEDKIKISKTDRVQAVLDYLRTWAELELAKRYA
jgi:type IV secretory pathway VirD2 relaxase